MLIRIRISFRVVMISLQHASEICRYDGAFRNWADDGATWVSELAIVVIIFFWDDSTRMVKEEKKYENPVAGLIDKLHLERNSMSLLLSNNLDEMDDYEITQPVEKVALDSSQPSQSASDYDTGSQITTPSPSNMTIKDQFPAMKIKWFSNTCPMMRLSLV
ncbi:hypothetical protein HanIR_Chr04g0150741 [Helianthus annuus]|nr:hypothetical protein HanIR_Chr04g0150741 [Helianthus annuus]